MKLFARLNVVVLLAISALLYLGWTLRSYHPITRAKKVWSRKTTEIIVFGDSWSTNHLELSLSAERPATPVDKKLWVDTLCLEVCKIGRALSRLISDPDSWFATASTTSPNHCPPIPRTCEGLSSTTTSTPIIPDH